MKNKLGFTLIELLAVIVILAIIALITTPIILNVIEDARKQAVKDSAYGYIDAVEKQIIVNKMDDNKEKLSNKVYKVSSLNAYGVMIKGEAPSNDSWVQIKNGQVVDYSLKIGVYVVNYDKVNKVAVVTKNGTIREAETGPVKIEATENDTHKGIVYLDPTNLDKTCKESDIVSTTGTKSGCMKWYIYDEEGNNYKMILDHNTTKGVAWSSLNVGNDTVGWQGSPRLISADEVAKITNNKSFNSATTTYSNWFYLDSNNQTAVASSTNKSKYAWLFDHTRLCASSGCNLSDSNTSGDGYYTSNLIYGGSFVWGVTRVGKLNFLSKTSTSYGIRPVITIPKSILE